MKTDLYTKIVLTVIAIFLGVLIIKDVDFVTKAQAKPADLDLSALKIEKAESEDEKEMTFFIYENSKIQKPFSVDNYERCEIGYKNVPTYIITNKKAPRFRQTYIGIGKTE
ncbi:hypothetical protein [uncultured Dysgonomonas sp.]|uniref:Uncharacterized protein n=1 Tax=uncultured Dysgonomonas sp. TaxID=206096 RepID=A0A212K691_9BACT|nr:hypothetical protein [uncultured Dysgonomonas sp.]SBW07162.1 exported hypothetical protein [uncultured Dysgonomonas sp.]